MRLKLFFILFQILAVSLTAQNINFSYDATGNRTQKSSGGISGARFFNPDGTIDNRKTKSKKELLALKNNLIQFTIDTSYQRMVELRNNPLTNQLQYFRDTLGNYPIQVIAQPVTGFFQLIIDDDFVEPVKAQLRVLSSGKQAVFSKNELTNVTMIDFQEIENGAYDLLLALGDEEKKWKVDVKREMKKYEENPGVAIDPPLIGTREEAEKLRQFSITKATSLREKPTSKSKVKLRFKAGDKLTVIDSSGKWWWEVIYKGKRGWVKKHLLKSAAN